MAGTALDGHRKAPRPMADKEAPASGEVRDAAEVLFPGEPAVQAFMAQRGKPARTRLREALALLDLRGP
jgi:hypothetical protein